MIELYLDDVTRERMLNYDIEHNERCYDDMMYYISNSESQILYDILFGMSSLTLEKIGFNVDDIDIILESDVNIKFTNKKMYYIKELC